MSVKTVKLGGTASNITVGKVAYGLMTLTRDPNIPTDEEAAFVAIKPAVDLMPPGAENLRRSVDACLAALRGTKKIDLFETARVDPNEEGKFDHIGMSECRAETLRKAHAIHPITAVEIEVSLWSYEEEARKVIATAEELGVIVIAYSPLSRGLLTGLITSKAELPEVDYCRRFDRFQDENLKHNLAILEEIKVIAARKQVTLTQLAIAWVASRGPHVIPLPGSTNAKRVVENIRLDQIADVLSRHEVKGERYIGGPIAQALHLWG
ncbi:Aldo/keto reductase [Dichomitus squalens]|uniref:Aldo/keto reductase n=1 Tax=Dichomitus squalens TaxID=114155 RepID=A0A4Q9NLB4_9APHY|nr:Aldo/keto reductase [Dichomitus squalens]TBU53915.1 Aldo/keto reductase [Dichomitus squalens]